MGANGSTFDDKAQVKLPLHKYANMKLGDFDDLWNRFKESGLGFALTPIDCGELLLEKNFRELKKMFNIKSFTKLSAGLPKYFKWVKKVPNKGKIEKFHPLNLV